MPATITPLQKPKQASRNLTQEIEAFMDVKDTIENFLLKKAAGISMIRGLVILSGLLLDSTILAYFGLGKETDAVFTALALPRLISSTILIQAPNVLVPVFTSLIERNPKEKANELIVGFVNLTGILLILISLVGIFSAPLLIPLQIPGLASETQSLAVHLTRLLFGVVFLEGTGTILNSFLNTYDIFFLPASSKLISNIVALGSVLVFTSRIGIYAIGLGYFLGATLSLLLVVLVANSQGLTYNFRLNLQELPQLFKIYKLCIFPFAAELITASRDLIKNFFASFLGAGSISALELASRIVQASGGFLVGGFVTPTLTILSRNAAAGRINILKRNLAQSIKIVSFIAIPFIIWLVFFSENCIRILYKRGNFSNSDVYLVSKMISIMVPYIIFSRINSIIQTPFYAVFDMIRPMFSTLTSLITYSFIVYTLIDNISVYSFPIAISISSFSSALIMYILFTINFGGLKWRFFQDFYLKLLLSSLVLFVGFLVGLLIVPQFSYFPNFNILLNLFFTSLIGICGFFVMCFILRLVIIQDKKLRLSI
jgi:putative peptidoglycan lipid II flippase